VEGAEANSAAFHVVGAALRGRLLST